MRKFNLRNESGQTALEAAIILIAFIVVASVFAFTILAAGTSSTEKGEEAIYAGLEGVQSSMTIKGSMVAFGELDTDDEPTGDVEKITFTLATVSGSDPIDLTARANETGVWQEDANNTVVIAYRDLNQLVNEIGWSKTFIGANDGDDLLEAGELAEITVWLTDAETPADGQLSAPLQANTPFTIEIKPPTGAVMALSRTTPSVVEAVMELR